jgi:hypothetical protein
MSAKEGNNAQVNCGPCKPSNGPDSTLVARDLILLCAVVAQWAFKSAPLIEAVESLSRAIELGLIEGTKIELEMLRYLVPKSRGGEWSAADAEANWKKMVAQSARIQKIDLEKIRRSVNPS